MDIIYKQRGDFKEVKQSYSEQYPETIICKCGNDEFIVGQGNYLTVIKCKKCGLETCIHDG